MLTEKYAQCTVWENRRGTEVFDEFRLTRNVNYDINHVGSAGTMESKGLVHCFASSVKKYNLRYTKYIGDGDTKSYLDVLKNDPYQGVAIK